MRLAGRTVGACVMAVLVTLAPRVEVSAQPQAGVAGERTPARGGVAESTATIMAREDDRGVPPDGLNGLTLPPGATFNTIGFVDTSSLPPDGSASAGPTQFIAVANGRFRTFTKAGVPDGVISAKPDTFFAAVKGSGGTFAPRVRFDRLSGRWFITMATTAVPGRILMASSNASTITAGTIWSFSSFDDTFGAGDCTTDGPTLGVDASALYIGVNQFCSGGSAFAGSSGYVVRKTSVLDGATPVVTAFHNLTGSVSGPGPFAPQGVNNDDPAAATGYFLGVDNASFGTLMLRRVATPGGTPTISANIAIPVAPTTVPMTVRHAGNTGGVNGYLSAVDDRLATVSMRGGHAWVAHTVGVNQAGVATAATRDGVRWYEIGSLDATPVIVQTGTVNDPAAAGSVDERNYFNASIAASPDGRAVVGFSAGGTREFVNAGLADRFGTDTPGTLRAPTLTTGTASTYNPPEDPGGPGGRKWGSYSETFLDACDGTTLWSVQQYVNATNSYTLQAAKVQTDGPPPLVSVSPSVIQQGLASVDLVVTAAPSGPRVFRDPPAGFACRVSASIPGVTVNSVTLTSPTSVTLNVSTIGTAGLKTVTVANPDGQTSSAAGLLNVLAGSVLAVEAPTGGSIGQPVVVRGYLFDGASQNGTGMDAVHVYATSSGGAVTFLGAANYGTARGDVAAIYGAQFRMSGFSLRAAQVLPAGAYTITVYGHSATTGSFSISQSVAVTLKNPVAPFGSIDTPASGTLAAGELGVTGWAMDEAGVKNVTIYRSPLPAEGSAPVFIGTANFSRGARPDVQSLYPAYPDADNAGWGYMLLTNMLPGQGNGNFVIYAYATNYAGQQTLLGARTITAANNSSSRPFGSIDTPGQGETVSGVIVNFGWALAKAGHNIPIDGSTIDIFVDNVLIGHPVYNNPRSDIAALFPGLANSSGPVGYTMIDTSLLADGVHTIQWVIRDEAGQASGVGSRYFRVQNGS